ncbi:MAG: BPTI/Kunitz-type proteinase inhibitor domain-containing protein [Nannocystaceae bacterium]
MEHVRLSLLIGLFVTAGCGPDASSTGDSDTGTTSEPTDTMGTDTMGTDTMGTAGPDLCLLEPEVGPCEAAIPMWAYQPQSGECYEWSYGGCDGVVPFESRDTCQSTCEPCELLGGSKKPAPAATPVPIVVRNNSADGVWMQSFEPNNGIVGYRLQPIQITPKGAEEPLITVPNNCDEGYELTPFMETQACSGNCTDEGPPPDPIYIAPGGIYPTTWDGQSFSEKMILPTRCWPEGCDVDEIRVGRWQNVDEVSFTAAAVIGTITCDDCSCEPNADGWCSLGFGNGASIESPMTLSEDFSWPQDQTVELVISP